MEAYADTGLVRFEYKNFAFLGPESTAAAEASECAAEQGMFWAYHDTIFLNHEGENVGTYSDPALKNYATALGLDQDQFDDCLDSREYRTNVHRNIDAMIKLILEHERGNGQLEIEEKEHE